MSGFDLPTKLQLTESCNKIETVLDALRRHTNDTLTNRSRILSPVKGLFTSLQRLEEDELKAEGAFHTADARAKHNLTGVITSCGIVAGQLRKRIHSNSLRHDDDLSKELMTLTNEIEDFLKLRKVSSNTTRPKHGTSSDSSTLVEDLLRKQQKHESEVEGLGIHHCYRTSTYNADLNIEDELHTLYRRERTFEEEIANRDKRIAELQAHNDAKLSHISRLHAAILNLGVRHPMRHQTYDWEDLTDELPTKIQWIENINRKLKELELEQDRLNDQERDFDEEEEEEVDSRAVPSAPKPPSVVSGSKLPTKDKDKDVKRRKEHRRTAGVKPVRSPSPASSETSKANTSKSVRRKGRNVGNGSGFFFRTSD